MATSPVGPAATRRRPPSWRRTFQQFRKADNLRLGPSIVSEPFFPLSGGRRRGSREVVLIPCAWPVVALLRERSCVSISRIIPSVACAHLSRRPETAAQADSASPSPASSYFSCQSLPGRLPEAKLKHTPRAQRRTTSRPTSSKKRGSKSYLTEHVGHGDSLSEKIGLIYSPVADYVIRGAGNDATFSVTFCHMAPNHCAIHYSFFD